jgi:hypothetical protein
MHLSVSFIVAALALSAIASPIDAVIGTKGTKTPLSKRFSLTNADGTANVEMLRSYSEFSMKCILISTTCNDRLTWSQRNPDGLGCV